MIGDTYTIDQRLKSEYHAYTCKMIAEFEEKGDTKILGFGEWIEQRNEPQRPNVWDHDK